MDSGEFIRKKRGERGLSEENLAERIGVSVLQIRTWESGSLPDSAYLLRLAETLGVTADEILRCKVSEEREKAIASDVPSSVTERSQSGIAQSGEVPNDEVSGGETQSGEVPNDEASGGIAQSGEAPSAEDSGGETSSETPKVSCFLDENSGYDPFEKYVKNVDVDISEEEYDAISIPGVYSIGFHSFERKIGYWICIFFLLFLSIYGIKGAIEYANRPRELTLENYRQYIEVDFSYDSNTNPKGVCFIVRAKETVLDLKVAIVFSYGKINDRQEKTITIVAERLEKGEQVSEYAEKEYSEILNSYSVEFVQGGLL